MYGVIVIPQFRLQAALRHEPEALVQPVALIENDPGERDKKKKHRIVELTAAARKHAVETGMTATQGQARCSELRILTRSEARERSAREALLQWAGCLSPNIEATGEGLCTIDLTGTPYARDRHEELGRRCVDALHAMDLEACVGIAADPELALLAARFALAETGGAEARPYRVVPPEREAILAFLDPLPPSALALPDDLQRVLTSWGIRTLGQLRALPKDQVVHRLGKEILPLWKLARGDGRRPLRPYQPPEYPTEAADFEAGIERLEALIFILNRFLQQIAARLTELSLVAEELTLLLVFEDGSRHEKQFRIPEPTRKTDLLLRTLHTYLENFTSKSAVVGVELGAKPARAVQQQLDLFHASLRDPNQFAETLARLEALLGPGRVGTPRCEPTHRPDAIQLAPFQTGVEPAPPDADTPPVIPVGLPLRRFRPPVPIQVQVLQGEGLRVLVRVSAREVRGRIKESRGPWLASGDWWDRNPWSREEWDVELEGGGLYRLAREKDGWLLDGVYD